MNNEIIKEGDYVIYICRPSEKFLVVGEYSDVYDLKIVTPSGDVSFNENGKYFTDDEFPIVKKTTPPKKKVLKEFEVYIDNLPTLNKHRGTFSMFGTPDREIKAKLICEVEE